MPAFQKRPKPRRLRFEKVPPGGPARPWLTFLRRNAHKLLLGILFGAALVSLTVVGRPPLGVHLGEHMERDIVARIEFEYLDPAEATRRLQEFKRSQPRVYVYRRDITERVLADIRTLLEDLQSEKDISEIASAIVAEAGVHQGQLQHLRQVLRADQKRIIVPVWLETWLKYGMFARKDYDRERGAGHIIVVMPEGRTDQVPVSRLPSTDTRALAAMISDQLQQWKLSEQYAQPLTQILSATMEGALVYDRDASIKAQTAAVAGFDPEPHRYEPGEVLVRRGTVIGPAELELLRHEQQRYIESQPLQFFVRRVTGVALVVTLVVLFFGVFAYIQSRRAVQSTMRMTVIGLLALLLVAATKLILYAGLSPYLVPATLVAIILALAYDRLFSVVVTVGILILAAVAEGGSFSVFFPLLAGAVTAGIATGRVRKRIRLVQIGTLAGIAQFAAVWAVMLLLRSSMETVWLNSVSGFANCVVCGFAVSGILPLIEKAFGVSTDISLLELSDLTQPLLKRLALEAPGTYNHSLIVGALSEGAAQSIGANHLLARVGSYFHDIGKLNSPDYYVENRGTAESLHDGLSPTMSTLVIQSHVKDGVEMARHYALPRSIAGIIRQHHGTTEVEYFKAKAEEDLGKAPEGVFRYPGPRPQSRESAIVMLADTVESACRTLSEPTPASVDKLVHSLADARIKDHQLDECDLTFRELNEICSTFVKILSGMYHSRVKYPAAQQP